MDASSVLIRRSEIEFVAADGDSSQPQVGGEKSEDETSTRDAEYGFDTSHEMAIRRREILSSQVGCHGSGATNLADQSALRWDKPSGGGNLTKLGNRKRN